jgi:nucleotide-binding universal stress UspA family protein
MTLDKRPILVALDGSPEAERGLEAARDLAKRAGAKIVLVRAFSIPPPVGIEFAYYPPDLLTTMQTAAQEYVAGAAQPGERTVLIQGSPAGAIEQAATDVNAGLVVMTSHGKGLAARLALGSTTDRVLHTVHRPMLIVPITEEQ